LRVAGRPGSRAGGEASPRARAEGANYLNCSGTGTGVATGRGECPVRMRAEGRRTRSGERETNRFIGAESMPLRFAGIKLRKQRGSLFAAIFGGQLEPFFSFYGVGFHAFRSI